jgi:hypothetical protein
LISRILAQRISSDLREEFREGLVFAVAGRTELLGKLPGTTISMALS